MSLLQKFKDAAASFGWDNAVLYGIHRVLGRIGGALHRYEFVAQPVASDALLKAGRGQSISVRLVPPADPALAAMPLTREVIERRSRQGAVCFGAFKGDRMIGCLWLCVGAYEEDEVRCRFELLPRGRVAWDFDVYLLPEHRLGPAFARLWDAANAYMRERGIAWSMSRISAYNPRSLAAHSRLGARRVASAIFLCLGRLQLAFLPAAPYVHFSTGRKRVPSLPLQAPANDASGGNNSTKS